MFCALHKVSVIILALYSVVNIVFLVGNILVISEEKGQVENIIKYLDNESLQFRDEVLVNTIRDTLVKNSSQHFALPITVTIVLLCSNLLAVWGVLFSLHLLVSL